MVRETSCRSSDPSDTPVKELVRFGTGSLLGRTSYTQSVELLSEAVSAGVVSFDTARLYGRGETEHLLGKELGGQSNLEFVTKAGLGRPTRRRGAAFAFKVARPAILAWDSVPFLHKRPGPVVDESRFSSDGFTTSVSTSQRLLRRAHLGTLLLHECLAADVTPEVLDEMDSLMQSGAVTTFGLAGRRAVEESRQLTRAEMFSVVQHPYRVVLEEPRSVEGLTSTVYGLFGPAGQDLEHFSQFLESTAALRKWRSDLLSEVDANLAELLIMYARHKVLTSPIVFTTSRVNRIRRTSLAAATPLRSDLAEELWAMLIKYRRSEAGS